MPKILITGATGLLGCSLVPMLRKSGYTVLGIGSSKKSDVSADLTQLNKTLEILDKIRPDLIVNLVALTDVDKCEMDPHSAYLLNVLLVENICTWIKASGNSCHLIQLSTDQLYNGKGPHAENKLNICNHYGMSKLAGEYIAKTVSSTILRTNFIGLSQCDGRTSLTDWLFLSLQNSKLINVFSDVMFSPLSIRSLCHYIEKCIFERPLGVYNVGSKNGISKADLAFLFADELGLSNLFLKRTKMVSLNSIVAKRPFDMRMNTSLFETRMGLDLPTMADEIRSVANDYIDSISY